MRPFRTQPAPLPLPPPATCAECAFDALTVAAALMVQAQGGTASMRMQILVCARDPGFVCAPPRQDILPAVDACLRRLPGDPAWRRGVLARAMMHLVGNPLASLVHQAAARIGTASGPLTAAGRAALHDIGAALGLSETPA